MFKRKELLSHIMSQFPGSFINHNNELILEEKRNAYLSLEDIEKEIELKCKLLEWVSRDASTSLPYSHMKRNRE